MFPLKSIGCGALLYKVDISRAFKHVKIDPGDYDLLRVAGCACEHLHPARDASQKPDPPAFEQRSQVQDTSERFCYVGMGIQTVVWVSYNGLIELMGELGLTISE